MALGGKLTGASALHVLGAWMLDTPSRVHLAIDPHRAPRRVVWVNEIVHGVASAPGAPDVVTLAEALTQAVLSEPLEVVVPAFDWALHTGRIDLADLDRIIASLPESARGVRDWVDPASQSVLESVARVRILSRGWRVRSQVRVGRAGAIDLVVEEHIALELDGREHHEKNFERDRRKNTQITLEGRHALRVTHGMLRGQWPRIEQAIAVALAARGHAPVGESGVAPREPRGRRRVARSRQGNSALPGTEPREYR